MLVVTGTGTQFSGPPLTVGAARKDMGHQTARQWSGVFHEGRHLIMNLLEVEVPVIGAINGPAYRHPEIPLLSDIVIASETAVIQDATHFQGGLVPGDSVHVVFPMLMGLTRARYFLLTGQALDAEEARRQGLINEVMPAEDVMPRALELAALLTRESPAVRRYTRLLLTEELKDRMRRLLGYGLALEGLAVLEDDPLG